MSTTTLFRDPLVHHLLEPRTGPCITILMPTHRTMPEAQQDAKQLKELAKEAEARLLENHEKRAVGDILERLHAQVAAYDASHASEGLALFIAHDTDELVRLPFPVASRVVAEGSFATREVIRARLGDVDHHVLVLSTKGAHLFVAQSDRIVGEVRSNGFPIENRHYTTDALMTSTARGQENQLREYHHQVDKAVRAAVGEQGRVVIAGPHEQCAHLLHGAQDRGLYIGEVPGNLEHVNAPEIAAKAWPVAYEDQKRRQMADLDLVGRTPDALRVTALSDVWQLVHEGRGRTLLVERDLRLPARREGDGLLSADAEGAEIADAVDDIIEEQLRKGGDVRILPNGTLGQYNGMALVLRY